MRRFYLDKTSGIASDFSRNERDVFETKTPLRRKLRNFLLLPVLGTISYFLLMYPPIASTKIILRNIAPQQKNELVLIEPSDSIGFANAQSNNAYTWNGSTLVNLKDGSIKETLAETVKQVKKNGTLDSLVIQSHGAPNMLATKGDQFISTFYILDGIYKEQQKLGKQIAKRIVFFACDTFSEESPNDMARYAHMAKKLQTTIVGSASIISCKGSFYAGELYNINPDGRVEKDQLSAMSPLMKLHMLNNEGCSSQWKENYVGRDFKEGQKLHEASFEAEREKHDAACKAAYAELVKKLKDPGGKKVASLKTLPQTP